MWRRSRVESRESRDRAPPFLLFFAFDATAPQLPASKYREKFFLAIVLLSVAGNILFHRSQISKYVADKDVHANPNAVASRYAEDRWREWGHVHVVVTPFMQNQADLAALARARLRLFREFCYPTMVRQTTQRFVWIIKIDPTMERTRNDKIDDDDNNNVVSADGNDDIVGELIRMIEPHPNFILVGTNDHSKWVADDFPKHINRTYCGDANLLRYIQSACARFVDHGNGRGNSEKAKNKTEAADDSGNELLLLTTKLDSDDGLHARYLETMQKAAKENILTATAAMTTDNERGGENRKKAKWLIWCVKRHIEWHASDGRGPRRRRNSTATTGSGGDEKEEDGTDYRGEVNTKNAQICVTPGMTIAYAPGEVLPSYMKDTNHGILFRNVMKNGGCGLENNNKRNKRGSGCISEVRDPVFAAVRSRTVTSAGMKHVQPVIVEPSESAKIWNTLRDEFGVSAEGARRANRYVIANGFEIARDNELGQCTVGHSCKKKTIGLLLNEQIRWVLNSGGAETVLPEDGNLFQSDYESLVKRMNSEEKRQWLNDVESARGKRRAAAVTSR